MHSLHIFIPLIPGNLKFSSINALPFVAFHYYWILQSPKLREKKATATAKGILSSVHKNAVLE